MIEQDIGTPMQDQPKPDPTHERLVAEYEELAVRLDRLGVFLDKIEGGEVKVDPITRSLLIAQHGVMTGYKGILAVRINARIEVRP
jgi:hypothetical protein